jgi:hypothetical protein
MTIDRRPVIRSVTRLTVALARWGRDAWLISGIALLLVVGLEAAYRTQAAARRFVSGIPAVPSGHPYADSAWYGEYRAEYDLATRLEWQPYVYYRRPPFEGRHINIDSARHRLTVHRAEVPVTSPEVYFFGGSTMWGDYQRDGFTIPSIVVAEMSKQGLPIRATNFGESGYVMTQGLLELELQLRSGARPDIVVFYDGINDVAAAVQNGIAGTPQNEFNRVAEFRLGRAIRGWEEGYGIGADLRALGLLGVAATERSQLVQRLRLMTRPPIPRTPDLTREQDLTEEILEIYSGTVAMVEALSRSFGFRAIYVWQPNPHASSKPRTDFESGIQAASATDPFQQQLGNVHRSISNQIGAMLDDQVGDRFVNLVGLFEGYSGSVWVDQIGHTTEHAASMVAKAISDRLTTELVPGRRPDN